MALSIREITEQNEYKILCDKAVFADKSKGRVRPEQECEIRTCFQRDRDRIIHCRAFRRLKHKTQVFLAPSGAILRSDMQVKEHSITFRQTDLNIMSRVCE